jgi:hypothetical protein
MKVASNVPGLRYPSVPGTATGEQELPGRNHQDRDMPRPCRVYSGLVS